LVCEKEERGKWTEDSPPTLKLRRIYVAADPWSAIKVKSKKLKTQPRLAELGGVTDEK